MVNKTTTNKAEGGNTLTHTHIIKANRGTIYYILYTLYYLLSTIYYYYYYYHYYYDHHHHHHHHSNTESNILSRPRRHGQELFGQEAMVSSSTSDVDEWITPVERSIRRGRRTRRGSRRVGRKWARRQSFLKHNESRPYACNSSVRLQQTCADWRQAFPVRRRACAHRHRPLGGNLHGSPRGLASLLHPVWTPKTHPSRFHATAWRVCKIPFIYLGKL